MLKETTYRLDEADIRQMRMRLFQALAEEGPSLDSLFSTRLVEQSKRREPDRQVILAHRPDKSIHELENEAAAVLRRPAVLIGALVDVRAEELLGQVAVSSVQLDAVKADLHGRLGSLAVVADGLLDMRHAQLDWRVVSVPHELSRTDRRVRVAFRGRVPRRGRGRHGREPRHLGDSRPAGMPQLAVDIAAFSVHTIDDPLPPGRLLLREETRDTRHAIALLARINVRARFLREMLQKERYTSNDGGMPSEMIRPPGVAR